MKLIKIVNGAEAAFIEAGTALADIRDRKLYREEAKTFEGFCNENWGWTANYVSRLLSAKEVLKSVPMGTITTERQARAVSRRVPDHKGPEVILEAGKSGSLTTKGMTKVVQEANKPRVTAGPPTVKDKLGIIVPEKALVYWNRGVEVEEVIMNLERIKNTINKAQEAGDKLYAEMHVLDLVHLSRFLESIRSALPHSVCPKCNGQHIEECSLCEGRGVISRRLYSMLPSTCESCRRIAMASEKFKLCYHDKP